MWAIIPFQISCIDDYCACLPQQNFSKDISHIYYLLADCTINCSLFPATLDTLFQGVQPSDCPLPCSTVSTETKLTNVIDVKEYADIGLTFVQTVKVNTVIKSHYKMTFSDNTESHIHDLCDFYDIEPKAVCGVCDKNEV